MSEAVSKTVDEPETAVRNRSRYAKTLHRRDPDAEEVRPACPIRSSEKEYTEVSASTHRPHYDLCGNPECFGGDWR